MKSIIIRDAQGRILFHFKRKKGCVESKVATDIAHVVSAKVVMHNGSRIFFPPEKTLKDIN